MPKNVLAKTHHSSHSCLLRWLSMCYGVMSCLPDSSHSGFSAFNVMSCSFNSSHRNVLSVRSLCPNVTSDEFIRKTFYAYCHPVFLISVDFKHTFPWLRFTLLRLMPAVSLLLCSCDTCPFMLRKAIFQRAKAYLSRCN